MLVLKKNYIKEMEEDLFKNLSSYENDFIKNYNKENIKELKILHSDINTSLDISSGRDIDGNGYSINISDFSFEQVKNKYDEIQRQLLGSINNFKFFLKNGIPKSEEKIDNISKLINLIKSPNSNVYDTYLRDYLQAPNSEDKKINFIYFLRRFSIFKKLISDDKNEELTFFLNKVFGINSKDYIEYNNDRILKGVDNLDELFYIFPFLRNLDMIGTLKANYINTMEKIKETLPGLEYYGEDLYITDLNIVIDSIKNNSVLFYGNGLVYYFSKEISDIISKLITIFSYDSLLNSVNDYKNMTDEDFLIKLSLFLFFIYSTNEKYSLKKIKDFDEKLYSKINVYNDDDRSEILSVIDEDFTDNNFILKKTYGSRELNNSLFYLFSSKILCEDIFLKNLLKENLLRVGHFFYVLKYFKNTLKDYYPLFVFGVFTTSEKKYICDYDKNKNVFLDQIIDVYNTKYKNVPLMTYK